MMCGTGLTFRPAIRRWRRNKTFSLQNTRFAGTCDAELTLRNYGRADTVAYPVCISH